MEKAAKKRAGRAAAKGNPTKKAGKPPAKRAVKAPAKKAPSAKAPAAPKARRSAIGKKTAAPSRSAAKRADFGAPAAQFFARQPPALRPIAEALRALIEEAAPDASASLKWGMPVYEIGGVMLGAIGGHKAHVNLIIAGPPDAFDDPEGRLSGAGKTGRHLRLTKLEELPSAAVRKWLRKAAELARKK